MPWSSEPETLRVDVLVIGGGAAACTAAIAAHEEGANVLVVDKGQLAKSGCSPNAHGGAALLQKLPGDSWRVHAEDTLGCPAGDGRAVSRRGGLLQALRLLPIHPRAGRRSAGGDAPGEGAAGGGSAHRGRRPFPGHGQRDGSGRAEVSARDAGGCPVQPALLSGGGGAAGTRPPDAFAPEATSDPTTLGIAARVVAAEDPAYTALFPGRNAARVTVHTDRGVFASEVMDARGDPGCPLSDADLEGKFVVLARGALGGEDAARGLARAVWHLDGAATLEPVVALLPRSDRW